MIGILFIRQAAQAVIQIDRHEVNVLCGHHQRVLVISESLKEHVVVAVCQIIHYLILETGIVVSRERHGQRLALSNILIVYDGALINGQAAHGYVAVFRQREEGMIIVLIASKDIADGVDVVVVGCCA